jgi:glycosyltransferase involved in cell wall biosynthesis
MRVAVISPYYREDLEILRRCHESVLQQTYACTHFFVADGHPREELSSWDVQHIVLPLSHGDNGNTPRGLGGISALNQGYDAIAYLDADNWYAPDHIQSLVDCCRETNCQVAFSGRHIVLSTGEHCDFIPIDEAEERHADTSCFFITAAAAFLLPMWAMMDQEVSPICDRLMLAAVRTCGFSHAWTRKRTVYYVSHWACDFALMGKPPPADAHTAAAVYDPDANFTRLGFHPMGENVLIVSD